MTEQPDLGWASVRPRRHFHDFADALCPNCVTPWKCNGPHFADLVRCSCGLTFKDYEARQRKGKNNRSRGNAIEREIAHSLGLTRVGHFGGAEDAGRHDEPFVASVKSGSGYFSERYWAQLQRMPVNALQTAILVVTDAPGAGHKRRAYVVVELEDWRALHVGSEELVGRIR